MISNSTLKYFINKYIKWLYIGIANVIPFKFYTFKEQPVLLISYPRSGSSWIGKILSKAKNVAYMREPLMQPSLKFEEKYKPNKETLDKFINNNSKKVWQGIPPKGFYDFSPLKNFFYNRSMSTLVIKEVLAWNIDNILTQNNIKMIIVLRNPLAVAESFNRLSFKTNNSWYNFGLDYGNNLSKIINRAKDHKHLIIKYEELASEPHKNFASLYSFIGIPVDDNFEKTITQFCFSTNRSGDPFFEERNSGKQINKWKDKIDFQIAKEVTKGYLDSGLSYYQEDLLQFKNNN